jgi:hypothetical protein
MDHGIDFAYLSKVWVGSSEHHCRNDFLLCFHFIIIGIFGTVSG